MSSSSSFRRIPKDKKQPSGSTDTSLPETYTLRDWFVSSVYTILADKYLLLLISHNFFQTKEEIYQLHPY
jgi:hypothetical protein